MFYDELSFSFAEPRQSGFGMFRIRPLGPLSAAKGCFNAARGSPDMHAFANPARFLRLARPLTPVLLLSGLAIAAAALVYGLLFAPAERLQGETVRILFIHVPTAWQIGR